jgi:hypothetical protein
LIHFIHLITAWNMEHVKNLVMADRMPITGEVIFSSLSENAELF